MNFAGNKYAYIPEKKKRNAIVKKQQKKEKKPVDINSMDVDEEESPNYLMKEAIKEEDSDSVESFSDDELNEEFLNQEQQPRAKKALRQLKPSSNIRHEKVVDTNVLSLKFEFLKNKIPFATGDPQYCSECKAVFNSYSKFEEKDEGFLWNCEFCNKVNILQMEKEEIPKEPCIDFFVESSNQVNKSSFNYTDNQSLIYCFDVSGSMCVTYPLDTKCTLKGSSKHDAMYAEMMKFSDGSDQHYQTNQKNITYVSRLQCLQGAIENNITSLLKNAPNMKVGIVTFNNKVSAYGDCLKAPLVIEGNKLNNEAEITQLGEKNRTIVSSPIQQSQKKIIDSLYSFEESGQTALGPAMLLSLSLIEKTAAGGRIILCTDGIANLGLGAIPDKATEDELKKAKDFYGKLGAMAKNKGIVINLITFQDEESQIQVLMEMIEKTGGEIIQANPKEIIENFSNLLTNEIVATNVSIKIKLHKVMSFRNEINDHVHDNGSTLIKTIGNATKETELYIEYMFKKSDEIAKLQVNIETLKEVPFQSIIEYTTPTGDKCIRVLTSTQMVSDEKNAIQEQSDFNIISTNAIQKTANIARQGDYRKAQANAYAWNNYLRSNQNRSNANSNVELFSNNVGVMNNQMQGIYEQQQSNINSLFGHVNYCRQTNVTKDCLMQQIHQNQSSSFNQQKMYFNKAKKKK